LKSPDFFVQRGIFFPEKFPEERIINEQVEVLNVCMHISWNRQIDADHLDFPFYVLKILISKSFIFEYNFILALFS
jgi:hypothetical protein